MFNPEISPSYTSNETAKLKQAEQVEITEVTKPREDLHQHITLDDWPNIPSNAVNFLAAHATSPIHLKNSLHEAQSLLDENPDIFSDEEFMVLFLENCLDSAKSKPEIAELDEGIEVEKTSNDEKEKIDAIFISIDKQLEEKGLKGRDALEFAIKFINNPESDISDNVREKLIIHFADIQAAVGEMLAVTDDPAEQAAIAQIVDNSALNLNGKNRRAVFANMVEQIDASENISEETKTKIKLEVLGVEGLDNATDTLNTLRDIRANDGKFRDAHGKIVEFSEEHGVDIDRYTIFPDPNNSNGYVAKLEVGGRTLRFPFAADTDPGYFNDLATSIAVASVFANRDLQAPVQHILGHDGFASQGYREIRLDEEQVQRAKRLYGAFMGFGVELQTKFPSPSDLDTFERRLQVTHPDGDLNTGDNTGRGDKGWEQIGMFENGKLNLERVEEAGAFIRKNYSSLPSFGQLVEMFGEDASYNQ